MSVCMCRGLHNYTLIEDPFFEHDSSEDPANKIFLK